MTGPRNPAVPGTATGDSAHVDPNLGPTGHGDPGDTGGIVATRTAPPAEPRPQATKPREYRFPPFERRSLPNGTGLLIATAPKLPLVTVLALVDAGAVADPEGQDGLAVLTARAIAEGTRSADGAALIERFERLGTALETSADWDAAVLRLTVQREHLEAALALLGEVLVYPIFPEREVERLKQERLAEILQQRAEPRGLADEMLARFLYADESRYSKPEGGSAASVAALTATDVARFYRTRYRPRATTIVLAGDIVPDEAERLAARALDPWIGDPVARVEIAAEPRFGERGIHLVSRPDAPQSELRVGQIGPPRSHPRYFPATVMNAVLGGLFSSRINLNLREAHAYTYGAFSGFEWRRGPGPWAASTAVRSDVTGDATRETLDEILRIRKQMITLEELSLATSYLDGVFPIRYETTVAIASALANLHVYDLPDDYYDTYRTRIRAVTGADVLESAQKDLDPEHMQVVVVGDPAAIRGPLERLEFGPVKVYDAEGQPTG